MGKHALPEQATAVKELAERLHTAECRLDHTENCGWFYEDTPSSSVPTWEGWAHKRYLQRAREVQARAQIAGLTINDMLKALEALGVLAI